jgi:hypothetical protein
MAMDAEVPPTGKPLIEFYQELNAPEVAALVIALTFLASGVLASIYTNILRDQSLATSKPFSLSRTQLMWWSMVIGLCVILYCGAHSVTPQITPTCLVLLGIGTATTISAKIIDSRQRDELNAAGNLPAHQDSATKNFFTDILSDEGGVSVHRFQAFAFNTIYGLSFLYSFFLKGAFPNYDGVALALLGISSAGYIGLKAFENKSPATSSAQNDELLDADSPPSMTAVG